MSSADWSGGRGILPGRETFGPLALMISTPIFGIVLFHVNTNMDSNFVVFAKLCASDGLLHTIYNIWPTAFDPQAVKMIAAFMAFELVLQKYMPGKTFVATITPNGNIPTYKANGMASYLFTLTTLLICSHLNFFRPALVYDKFGEILSSMNLFALLFSLMLLVKGKYFPSSSDSGTTGNYVIDFWWGTELYPRIFGWDVKMFTNCRIGMMFWAVGILCFAAKNMEQNDGNLMNGMFVNVALQIIYITKFFHWEMGYMCSMDIQHDRAGMYICWGCLFWVPSVYTSTSFYLAEHAPELSNTSALIMFLLGFLMIAINYDSDNQRYVFRRTNGECLIWGRKPKRIVAEYEYKSANSDNKREVRKSLLLLSGWWSISRHFHYVPEILQTFLWSAPALTTNFIAPYFYLIFLTILLIDRAFRDDDRCRRKYGQYWEMYCAQVPYKIVPGLL